MLSLQPIPAALALAFAIAACGEEPPARDAATPDGRPITVPLAAENGSGRSGEATLEPDGDGGMRVVVTMDAGSTLTNPAHIHDVTCEQYRGMDDFSDQLGTVRDTLRTLRDGASETAVSASVAERSTGGFSINVHEPKQPYPVVACGDIPRR